MEGDGLQAEEVLIVGDRLDREIRAGRRLGCWTCRMEHGEGGWASPRDALEQPHYTVGVIEGVVAVVEDLESGGT
jgi:FMN phosphatase YigB (HAD superfamily)